MIRSAQLQAVVRCAVCGDVVRREFSLFSLSGGRSLTLECACSHEVARLRWQRGLIAGVICAVCVRPHPTLLSPAALTDDGVAALICPATDVELGFLGSPAAVTARAEPWAQELARAGAYAKIETYPVSRETMTDFLGFLHHLTRDGKLSNLHENRSADPWDADF